MIQKKIQEPKIRSKKSWSPQIPKEFAEYSTWKILEPNCIQKKFESQKFDQKKNLEARKCQISPGKNPGAWTLSEEYLGA